MLEGDIGLQNNANGYRPFLQHVGLFSRRAMMRRVGIEDRNKIETRWASSTLGRGWQAIKLNRANRTGVSVRKEGGNCGPD